MGYCIEEVKIYFYSEKKDEFLLKYLIPFLQDNFKEYFIDRDWYGGPNFTITMRDQDKRLKTEIMKLITQISEQYKIDEKLLEDEKNKYFSASKDLAVLEKRTSVDRIYNHLEVIADKLDMKSVMDKYNSLNQYEMYVNSRFQMQEAYNGILEELNLNKENRLAILVDLFIYISSLFEGGLSKGYLSYVSHVQGFFALFRKKGKRLDDKFENIYQQFKDRINGINNENININSWKSEWQKVRKLYYENFDFNKYKEDGFYNLDSQYDNLKKNMEYLKDSEFHNLLLENKLKELYFNKHMIIFRNVINTFYKSLPFIGVSFIEKHLCGYMAYRYVEDNIIHDTWKNNFSSIINDNRRKNEIIF